MENWLSTQGKKLHRIYCYKEIIKDWTKSTSLGQRYHHFGTPYSTQNDRETTYTFITDLHIPEKILLE